MIFKVLFVVGMALQICGWLMGSGKIPIKIMKNIMLRCNQTSEDISRYVMWLCRICLVLGALCIWTIAWFESDIVLFFGQIFLLFIFLQRLALGQEKEKLDLP